MAGAALLFALHFIAGRLPGVSADGAWQAEAGAESGWSFWNGNCVGGSSNFMSGYFHRLRPIDFHLLSEFGPIEGANIAGMPDFIAIPEIGGNSRIKESMGIG